MNFFIPFNNQKSKMAEITPTKCKISRNTVLPNTGRAGVFPGAMNVITPPQYWRFAAQGSDHVARACLLIAARNIAEKLNAACCVLCFNDPRDREKHFEAVDAALECKPEDASKIFAAVSRAHFVYHSGEEGLAFARNMAHCVAINAMLCVDANRTGGAVALMTHVNDKGEGVCGVTEHAVPFVLLETFRMAQPANIGAFLAMQPDGVSWGFESHCIVYVGFGVVIAGYYSCVYPASTVVEGVRWHAEHRGVELRTAILVDFACGAIETVTFCA